MYQQGEEIDIWVVERALGSGGMGSVYRCHNRSATRILAAVKVLESSIRRAPEAEARFIREAEILFNLAHPNIVQVRNVRTDMDPPYLEMEFVEGDSLENRLQRGALSLEDALSVVDQVLDALVYMHEKGVRHRDIKPANIIVKGDGRVKLVDFGLAMDADATRLTQAGMTFGTVSYAPPEWIQPDRLEPELWDIYATGVLFWECLTGQVAFPTSGEGSARQQAMQVIVKKQNHPPLDPGESFHEDLRRLIADMTASQPNQRIRKARTALSRLRNLEPSLARRTGTTIVAPEPIVDDPPQRTGETYVFTDVPAERTHEPAPSPLPEVTSQPPRRRGRVLLLAAAPLAMLVALAACTGLAAITGLLPSPGAVRAPVHRPVEVALTGLPDHLPVDLILGDESPVSRSGHVFRFPDVAPGEVQLTWTLGEECAAEACPGARCPAWCVVGRAPHTIPAGADRFALSVALEPPAPRTVTLASPKVEGARLTVDGEATEGTLDLAPGRYAVVAVAGECPEEAVGCGETCPAGCSSWAGELVVPAGEGTHAFEIPLEPPAPVQKTTRVAKTTRRPTSGGGGGLVTYGRYARWLAGQAAWQQDQAIAASTADGNYLADWQAGSAPAGKADAPVVNVSWYAAAAYCQDRGGLAPLDGEPRTWTEGSGAPSLEWRVDGGKAAWRSSDGTTSTRVNRSQSNAWTGFRCAR